MQRSGGVRKAPSTAGVGAIKRPSSPSLYAPRTLSGSASAAGEFWGRNEPGLSEDACRYLAEAAVVAVASDTAGCDVPCVDGEIGFGHGHSSWFLPRGILIVEGLRGLDRVAATGLFVALPLKIAGGTGSPLRVLLLDRGEGDGA